MNKNDNELLVLSADLIVATVFLCPLADEDPEVYAGKGMHPRCYS